MTGQTSSQSPTTDMTTDERLANLERFISRRFDEISMEIEATSQLIDMAEEGAGKRFREMLGMLHAITFSGAGDTPANSGAELEAVIIESEEAANRILDAADRIAQRIEEDRKRMNVPTDRRANSSDSIESDIQEILMACAFQDLTGQRIRKALENIKTIEERLSATLSKFGITLPTVEEMDRKSAEHKDDFIPDPANSQNDIDALFD